MLQHCMFKHQIQEKHETLISQEKYPMSGKKITKQYVK